MDQRALVVRLQAPFADYCADDATARDVILAGLSWSTDTPAGYWQGLAVDWIEQGAAVDAEMTEFLKVIATTAKLPQQLRHKARAIVQRQSEDKLFILNRNIGPCRPQAAGRLGHSLGNENESVQFDFGKSSGGDSSISTKRIPRSG